MFDSRSLEALDSRYVIGKVPVYVKSTPHGFTETDTRVTPTSGQYMYWEKRSFNPTNIKIRLERTVTLRENRSFRDYLQALWCSKTSACSSRNSAVLDPRHRLGDRYRTLPWLSLRSGLLYISNRLLAKRPENR